MTVRVAAVVLHYDRPESALDALDSLRGSEYPAFELLVVDNGSAVAPLARLRAGLEQRQAVPGAGIRLVTLDGNRGYTGGVNAAFEAAVATGAAYVWLLADDVRVAPDAMAELVVALENDAKAGVAGALTYYASEPTRIWFAGGFIERTRLGRARHRGLDDEDRGQYVAPEHVDYANGSSLFARRTVVERIGGLDEAYFTYWEDADWCARARAAGWDVLFVPTAKLWHHVTPDEGARLDRARLYDGRNRLIWHARHRPRRLWPVVMWTLAAVPAYVISLRAHEGWLQVRGLVAFLQGSTGRMA